MNSKGLVITAATIFVSIIGLIMYLTLWADDVAYKKAIKADSIEEYQAFLTHYSKSEFVNDIQSHYDKCAYFQALSTNTEDTYSKFLKEHPSSFYVDSVKNHLEELNFEKAIKATDVSVCQTFLNDYPNSKHAQTIQKRIEDLEHKFYVQIISTNRVKLSDLQVYNRLFPNGRYASQVATKQNQLKDKEDYESAQLSNTKNAWQQYLDNHPKGKFISHARSKIREFEELEYYSDYSLKNGSQPYASKYGYNCSNDYGRAMVRINASAFSDVLVIVRYNNNKGRVAGHVYVKKGCTSTIYLLPEHRYQVFFYYGTGWYPKKEMANGLRGGFLNKESFDKDGSSHYFDWGEGIEYTLTEQVGGNFSTSKSSESEMF